MLCQVLSPKKYSNPKDRTLTTAVQQAKLLNYGHALDMQRSHHRLISLATKINGTNQKSSATMLKATRV